MQSVFINNTDNIYVTETASQKSKRLCATWQWKSLFTRKTGSNNM